MSESIFFELEDFAQRAKGTWLDGKIAHLSASSLGMFRRCPRQWQQRYLFGKKEPPGEALVIGSFFHETLNFNYGSKIMSHEDRPLSELVEFLQDAAVPRVVDAAGGVGEIRWDVSDPRAGLDTARSDSQRILTAYHAQVMPRVQPVATEQRLEWHHPGWPVPLIGYLDTIADNVIDTKTGKQAVSKLKPSWRLQADIYSSWCGKGIEYHSINRAATPKIMTPLESEALYVRTTQEEAKNLLNVVTMMCEQIQWMYDTYGLERDWPTWGRYADWTQNTLPCDFCGYRAGCPAWS